MPITSFLHTQVRARSLLTHWDLAAGFIHSLHPLTFHLLTSTPCSYSQAIRLIETGRFKGWKGARAPGLAVAFYALPVSRAAAVLSADCSGWWHDDRLVGRVAATCCGNEVLPAGMFPTAGGIPDA